MSDHPSIYRATLGSHGVSLEKVERGRPGYKKAAKAAIVRQRDAIERYRKLKASGKGVEGKHDFRFLESARTFAILHLQGREREVQDNLDRILEYDGK